MDPAGGEPTPDAHVEALPPYGAALMFEVHREHAAGAHRWVQLHSQAGPDAPVVVLPLPGGADNLTHPDLPGAVTSEQFSRWAGPRRFDSSEVRRSLGCGLCQALCVSNLHVRSQLHALFSSSPSSHPLSMQMCGEPNRALSAMPLNPESPGLAAPSPQAQTLVPHTHTPLSPTHATGGGGRERTRQSSNAAWCGACEATGTLATCPPPPSITVVPVAAPSDERSSLHAPSSDPVQVPVLVRAPYPPVCR